MEVRKLKEKAVDYWHFCYCEVISIIATVVIISVERKCKIQFWNAQNFADMLTALITFLSIVLGIYSFLIPSFVSAKEEEKIKNFLANADMYLFSFFIRYNQCRYICENNVHISFFHDNVLL